MAPPLKASEAGGNPDTPVLSPRRVIGETCCTGSTVNRDYSSPGSLQLVPSFVSMHIAKEESSISVTEGAL